MNSIQAIESNYGQVCDEADICGAQELLLRRNIRKAVADLTSKSPQAILLRDPIEPVLQQRNSEGIMSFQLPRGEPSRGLSLNESGETKPAARSSSIVPKDVSTATAAADCKGNKKNNIKPIISDWSTANKLGTPQPTKQRFLTPEKPSSRVSLNSKLTGNKELTGSKQKPFGKILDKNLYTIAEDNTLKPSTPAIRSNEPKVDSSGFLIANKTDSQQVLPSSRAILAKDQSISDSNKSVSRDKRAFDSRQGEKRESLQIKTKALALKFGSRNELVNKDSMMVLKKNTTISSIPVSSSQAESAIKSAPNSLTLKQALKKQQELKEQILNNMPDKPKPPGETNQRAKSSYYITRNPAKIEAEPPKEFSSMRRSNLQSVQADFQIKSVKLVLPRSPTPKIKTREGKKLEQVPIRLKESQGTIPTESSQLFNDKYYMGQKKFEKDSNQALSKESTRSQFMRPGSAQVLLSKKQKPDLQVDSGLKLDSGRKYSLQNSMMNMLYAIYMRTKPNAPGQQTAQVKHNVAEGNNGRFVEGMIRQKPGTIHENSHPKANIQWSQTYHAKIVVTSLKFVPRLSLKELVGKEEYEGLDVLDAEAMTRAVIDQRVFRVANPRVLKDLFQSMIKANQIGFMMAEALNVCNHLKGISCIAHKTKLTMTILRYARLRKMDPGSIIPKTFLLKIVNFERDFDKFVSDKKKDDGFKAPVIIKPGENSNRGNGITMAYSADEAATMALQILRDRKNTSCAIVQYYITNPLLYQRRKFDIRCYGLVVKFSGRLFFYWYLDGYARTSSFEFSLANKHNLMVHLTNEAVQVKGTAS